MSSPFTPLYEIRERMLGFYGKYGIAIRIVYRFILVFMIEMALESKTGYVDLLSTIAVRLIIALICAFLPFGFINVIISLLLLYEMVSVSLVIGGITLLLLITMILLDMLFSPAYRIVIYMVPLMFFLKVPYLLPICLGLIAPMSAILPMVYGLVIYSMLDYINRYAGMLSEKVAVSEISDRIRQILIGIAGGRMLYLLVAVFVITMLFVYVVRRFSMDHSWTIAVFAGAGLELVLLLFGMGSVVSETGAVRIPSPVISCIASAILACCLAFFLFCVDYKAGDYVEFEDDDYHYYVKVVPKIHVSEKVKNKMSIEAEEEISEEMPADTQKAAEDLPFFRADS